MTFHGLLSGPFHWLPASPYRSTPGGVILGGLCDQFKGQLIPIIKNKFTYLVPIDAYWMVVGLLIQNDAKIIKKIYTIKRRYIEIMQQNTQMLCERK